MSSVKNSFASVASCVSLLFFGSRKYGRMGDQDMIDGGKTWQTTNHKKHVFLEEKRQQTDQFLLHV